MLNDARRTNNLDLATDLAKIDFIANERTSDKRISAWSTNQRKLGRIDADLDQRIQENIGLRREAENLLDVGKPTRKSDAVKARLMQLLSARNELSSTTNRREVYRDKIKQINSEIAAISETKKLLPADKQVSLENIVEAQRQGVAEYKIDNKRFTKENFLNKINKMSNSQLMKSRVSVSNDNTTADVLIQKFDAIQKQETGIVPDVKPTEGIQKVEAEVRVAEVIASLAGAIAPARRHGHRQPSFDQAQLLQTGQVGSEVALPHQRGVRDFGEGVVSPADGLDDRQVGTRVAYLVVEQESWLGQEHAPWVENDLTDVVVERALWFEPLQVGRHTAHHRVGSHPLLRRPIGQEFA